MTTALLVAARIFAILRAQVLWRRAVGPLWWIAALALAILVAPAIGPVDPRPLDPTAVLAELLLGTVLGIVASLPGWALLGAATQITVALRGAGAALAGLTVAIVLAIAMSLDLHHAMLAAALDTFAIWPVGDPRSWSASVDLVPIVRGAHALLVLALGLATPVLLTAAIVEIAAALLARGPVVVAAPVGAAAAFLRAALAIVALAASWQAYAHTWARAATLG